MRVRGEVIRDSLRPQTTAHAQTAPRWVMTWSGLRMRSPLSPREGDSDYSYDI